MLKACRGFFLGLTLFLSSGNIVLGQINISPYTVNGLGDINSAAFTTNLGMGGIGVSNGQSWYLNNLNPALLTKNVFTVLEAGMVYESRRLENDSGLSQNNSGGGLGYFAMAFPVISNRWTSGLGIMPLTTVNYNILSEGTVIGNDEIPLTFNYTGEGGLTQAYFSNGFKIAKNLSIGVKASILFGSIVNETLAVPGDQDFPIGLLTSVVDKTSIHGFTLSSGLAYSLEIKDKRFLNIGFTYDIESDLRAKKLKTGELRRLVGNSQVSVDTLIDDSRGDIRLPSRLGFGLSYEILYKLTVGADLHMNNWSDFQDFEQRNASLVDNYGINLGAEFTPDITSVESYLKRVTYRLGFDYQKTPFEVSDQQLDDFGINFGVSFPVKGLSTMNLAFKYGQRGTTDDGLIQENYVRVYFGISFNDRWFQRRVLN